VYCVVTASCCGEWISAGTCDEQDTKLP